VPSLEFRNITNSVLASELDEDGQSYMYIAWESLSFSIARLDCKLENRYDIRGQVS